MPYPRENHSSYSIGIVTKCGSPASVVDLTGFPSVTTALGCSFFQSASAFLASGSVRAVKVFVFFATDHPPSQGQPRASRVGHFFRGDFAGLGGGVATWRTMRSSVSSLVSTPATRAASSNRRDCSYWDTGLRFRSMHPHCKAVVRLESVAKKCLVHNSRRVASSAMGRGSRLGLTFALTASDTQTGRREFATPATKRAR